MKNIFKILPVILFSVSSVVAQPTITSSKFYTPGVSLHFNYADTLFANSNPVTEGSSGANQTWDFSGLVATTGSYTNSYENASSTPYSSSYPGSNYSIVSTSSGSPDPSYSYLTHTSSGTVFNGVTNNYGGTIVNFIYPDPQTFFVYPTTYNSSGNDTYAGSYSITVSGITNTTYHNGNATSIADGYGIVITPAGTFTNCIRYKSTQHNRDSSVYVGLPIPGAISSTDLISYTYIAVTATSIQEVLSISYNSRTSSTGTTHSKTISYFTSATTGLTSGENNPQKKINVYPNPVKENASIKIEGAKNAAASLEIYDVKGQIVRREEIFIDSKSTVINLPTLNLDAGLYMAVVRQEDLIWNGKFLKK